MAPTGIALSAQVQLSWSSASLAAGYYIKRSTTPGGPYDTIATNGLVTSYADLTVVNDTTYYYVVSAFNSAGESANATEIAVTPSAAPGPGKPSARQLLAPASVSMGSTVSKPPALRVTL